MNAPEFTQFLVPNDHAIVKVLTFKDNPALLIRLIEANISDGEFQILMGHIKTFLRLVRKKKIKYHFVIDVHMIENIPYMKLIEIQTMLSAKRDVLARHLHNTVIITQSEAMKKIVDASMLLYEPARPFALYVAHPPQDTGVLEIPTALANSGIYTFMENNLNTYDLNDKKPDCIDICNLPRK